MLTESPCLCDCSAHPMETSYAAGVLPKTDAGLARTNILSVGVTDLGLGTDFRINILTDERAIADKAEEFRDLTTGVV